MSTAFEIDQQQQQIDALTAQIKQLQHQLQQEQQRRQELEHQLYETSIEPHIFTCPNDLCTMLRLFSDRIDDGFLLLDHRGYVITINHILASWLNISPAQMYQQHWFLLLTEHRCAFPSALIEQSLHDSQAHQRLEHYITTDGQTWTLDIQTMPLALSDTPMTVLIVHVINRTEQRLKQALLAQSERFAANETLAITMAHELNTPLQSIQNCLYLARRVTNAQLDDYLDTAEHEIERMSSIVHQLLHLYHPDSSKPALLQVNDQVERVLLFTGSILMRRGIRVRHELTPQLPTLWARADHITQALTNVILLLASSMQPGDTLLLRTWTGRHVSSRHDVLVIDVIDTAYAWRMHQQRIATPSAAQTLIEQEQFQLGLTVSQHIIYQNSGQITSQAIDNSSLVVSLSLPLDNTMPNP